MVELFGQSGIIILASVVVWLVKREAMRNNKLASDHAKTIDALNKNNADLLQRDHQIALAIVSLICALELYVKSGQSACKQTLEAIESVKSVFGRFYEDHKK